MPQVNSKRLRMEHKLGAGVWLTWRLLGYLGITLSVSQSISTNVNQGAASPSYSDQNQLKVKACNSSWKTMVPSKCH